MYPQLGAGSPIVTLVGGVVVLLIAGYTMAHVFLFAAVHNAEARRPHSSTTQAEHAPATGIDMAVGQPPAKPIRLVTPSSPSGVRVAQKAQRLARRPASGIASGQSSNIVSSLSKDGQ